jgi:endoglucanase
MNPLKILTEVCSLPTAPFAERFVVDYIERFVRTRKKLRLSRDRFGNRLITLPGRRKSPRIVFAAHMDHPGFVAQKMLDSRTLQAAFRGWVQIDYVRGAKVRFFDGDREIAGQVIEATGSHYDLLTVPDRVKVRVAGPVNTGAPGMFDQGAARIRSGKCISRGIDDLGGLAACLVMLDQLATKPPKSTVAVLLTRAEEDGFIGAIAASLHPQLIRKTDRLIAIETSSVQPFAPQGKGVIVRVGDKTSIFNSALTYFLTLQAADLAKRDKSFHFQRALMPGGTCEASIYDVYGFSAAALCIALANYHNMDRGKKKIAPEFIDVNDWKNMVKLFVQVARTGHTFDPSNTPLRERIEKRFNRLRKFLT